MNRNGSKVHDYMNSQPEISDKMRAIFIDWLIEVHKFELTNETLYLTINVVDRFLAAETVARRELQCVDMNAMLIASKHECNIFDFFFCLIVSYQWIGVGL